MVDTSPIICYAFSFQEIAIIPCSGHLRGLVVAIFGTKVVGMPLKVAVLTTYSDDYRGTCALENIKLPMEMKKNAETGLRSEQSCDYLSERRLWKRKLKKGGSLQPADFPMQKI